MAYGKHLILDLQANANLFNYYNIRGYLIILCDKVLKMERVGNLSFVESEASEAKNPQTFGISACQFIMSSSITIHALSLTGKLFVDVFSCQDFDQQRVINLTRARFDGALVSSKLIDRE